MKPKYGAKSKPSGMDTDIFIFYIKTENIYSSLAKVVETIFDNSNYELNKPLTKRTNKKAIWVSRTESEKV